MEKTKFYSYKLGKLAKGCRQCVKGEKSVLFVTGLCSSNCYFCPISDQKKNKDVTYINEWPTDNFSNIVKEIKLCESKGVGITGGDPLVRLSRTCSYIKKLKNEFGKKFHIHLYTPLDLVTIPNLKKLHAAGLDEIRFHPDLEKPDMWTRLEIVSSFNWDWGIEIPVIPNQEKITLTLLDYVISLKPDFINLNELEISDTNANKILDKGHIPKDKISYGVKGSEQLAKKILRIYKNSKSSKINFHYCTTKLKDKVQLASRIKKRAKNVKKETDYVDEEGILIRGVIYHKDSKPGFGYRNSLCKIAEKKLDIIKALSSIQKSLIESDNIPKRYFFLDKRKLRLITTVNVVMKLSEKIKNVGLVPAIVREYPTWDEFEVEIDFL